MKNAFRKRMKRSCYCGGVTGWDCGGCGNCGCSCSCDN